MASVSPRNPTTSSPGSQPPWPQRLAALVESCQDRAVIIGIGHPLKSDDYVGSLVAKDLVKDPGTSKNIMIIDAENSPENVLHLLWKKQSKLVIIIDSLETGLSPGTIILADLDNTTYPYFSTHNIPVRVLFETAPESHRIVILGVQPGSREFGEPLSREVENARRVVVRELRSLMTSMKGDSRGD